VLRATFTPDDRYVVLGDAIGDICVWDLLSNETSNDQPTRIPGAHAKAVSNVSFHPAASLSSSNNNKNTVAAASKKHVMLSCASDGLAKFWS